MHAECPACGQDFLIEPGFYMGASYIHYGFTAIITAVVVLTDLLLSLQTPIWLLIGFTLVANAILFPIGYRYSKILMLHWFGGVEFDPHVLHRAKRVFVSPQGDLVAESDLPDFDT